MVVGVGEQDFRETVAALNGAVETGLCLGASARVWVDGAERAKFAVGQASAGVPLTPDAAVPWFSASKLAATVAVAWCWAAGFVSPSDLVRDHLPEFTGPGKDATTVAHLLTHTAPLRTIDREIGGSIDLGRDALLRLITSGAADPDWIPGARASYLGHAGYLLLDEIVVRAVGRTFADVLNREVLEPLGMSSRLGGPPGVPVVDVPWNGAPELAARVGRFDVGHGYPSACMAGPFGEAGVLAEMLRCGGAYQGRRILPADTCVSLLRDARPLGLVDEAAQRPRRWGLGVMLDADSFGPGSSAGSFGALGGLACTVYSDPACGLTAALFFNGNVPGTERLGRDRAANAAIRDDLTRL